MMVITRRLVEREIGLGDALDVGRGDALEDLELAVGRRDVVVDHGGVRELAGLEPVGFAAQDVVARELVLRALQLVLAHRLGRHALQFRDQGRFHLGRRAAGLHDGRRVEQVRVLDDVAAAKGRQRQARVVHQLAIDPGALSVRQDLRGHVQRIRVRMAVVSDVVRDDDGRQRPGLFDRDVASPASSAALAGCRAARPSAASGSCRSTARPGVRPGRHRSRRRW